MNKTLKGLLLAGSTGLLWGLTTLATKLMGKAGAAISTAVFFRMVIIVAILGPWLWLPRPEELRAPRRDLVRVLIFSVFAPFGVYLGFMLSVAYLDAAQALVLHYTYPMVTALCSQIAIGERPGRLDYVGAALVTAGVAFSALTPQWTLNTHLDVRGILWGLAAIVGLAGQTLMVRDMAKRGGMGRQAFQFYSHIGGLIWISLYITLAGEWHEFLTLTPWVMTLIFVPTFLSCLVAYALYYKSLEYVPASVSSLMASLEILSGVVLTAVFAGMAPTAPQVLGCFCIFTAIVLVSIAQMKKSA